MNQTARDRLGQLHHIVSTDGFIAGVSAVAQLALRTLLPQPYGMRTAERIYLVEAWSRNRRKSSLPLSTQVEVYRKGFTEELYYQYGFDRRTDWTEYLTEYARRCAKSINDRPEVLENKELFHEFLHEKGYGEYLPTTFGFIENGTFEGENDHTLQEVVEREGKIVCKEVIGGGGSDVYIGEWADDGLILSGKYGTRHDGHSKLSEFTRAIVTEYCSQASYLDEIYPGSANTIRILTMNPVGEEPFIAAASHRFGSKATGELDNFAVGGLATDIDIETGTLSSAASFSWDEHITWHETHPDTGAQIEGVVVPEWTTITETICQIARSLPEVRHVGWDVLVTAPGEFVFVEGNHYPNPHIFQIHEPLLRDTRVKAFYRENNIPIPQ